MLKLTITLILTASVSHAQTSQLDSLTAQYRHYRHYYDSASRSPDTSQDHRVRIYHAETMVLKYAEALRVYRTYWYNRRRWEVKY